MSKIISKPTTLKLLNVDKYAPESRIEIERFNGLRKIVNIRGGVEKAVRAYNNQASRKIGESTFIRYMSPGSNGANVASFILEQY